MRFLEWEEVYERVIDNYCKCNVSIIQEARIDENVIYCFTIDLKMRKVDFNELRVFEPVEVNNQLQVAYYGSEKEECFGVLTNYLMDDDLLSAGYLLNNDIMLVSSITSLNSEIVNNRMVEEVLNKSSVVGADNWRKDLKGLNGLFSKEEVFILGNLVDYLTE